MVNFCVNFIVWIIRIISAAENIENKLTVLFSLKLLLSNFVSSFMPQRHFEVPSFHNTHSVLITRGVTYFKWIRKYVECVLFHFLFYIKLR